MKVKWNFKKNVNFLLFIVCLSTVIFLTEYQAWGSQIKPGELINSINCIDDANINYALFLPSNYSEQKIWPVIFCLDPGARGNTPVKLFQSAAEKYGYIVIGSNNCKNGPWEPNIKAIFATWHDVDSRFSLDADRIYAVGFSGGSRAATAFPAIIKRKIAGIIGCGAGLPSEMKAEQINSAAYFGIVGYYDYNYKEMLELEFKLKKTTVYHRMLYFYGKHRWPSQEQMQDALEWLELLAMKNGTKKVNSDFLDQYFTRRISQVKTIKQKNRTAETANEYHYLIKDFSKLKNMDSLQEELKSLKNSQEYKISLQDKKDKIIEEYNHESRFKEVFSQLEKTPLTASLSRQFITKLGVEDLVKQSLLLQNFNDSAMAERLLSILSVKAHKFGNKAKKANNFPKSLLYFEILRIATKDHANSFYYLAAVHCYFKNKTESLEHLQTAIDKGFKYFEALASNPDFDAIRDSAQYKKLTGLLQKKK